MQRGARRLLAAAAAAAAAFATQYVEMSRLQALAVCASTSGAATFVFTMGCTSLLHFFPSLARFSERHRSTAPTGPSPPFPLDACSSLQSRWMSAAQCTGRPGTSRKSLLISFSCRLTWFWHCLEIVSRRRQTRRVRGGT